MRTSAGRFINLTDSGGTNYVTNVKYAPPGEATSYTNGTSITNTNFYGARLQPWFLTAYTATAPIMELCYDFHSAQAVSATADGTTCSFAASAAGDNGNINQIVNERNTNRSQNFTYDSLNRIQQAWTTGTNWGETFTIDAWGNLTNKGPVGGKTSYESLNAAPANNKNQLNGYCHDSAGSLILNAGCPTGSFVPTYSYDAENRMVSNPGATYVYDGDGNRVKKVGSTTTLYWYGATGDILTETDASGGTVNDYIFFGGQRVARRDATNIRYYFSDHLGSHSLITDANGDMPPQSESDFYPYGGEMVITSDSTNNHYKFTSKERDAETCGTVCLDNFGARYDASAMGRFMTADPFTVTPGRVVDPQQLNLYAYVRNNPLKHIDPTGMIIDDSACMQDMKHCGNDWKKVQDIANEQDKNGKYTHPELHKIMSALQSDSRTFAIENTKMDAGTAGNFKITNFTDNRKDFTKATLQLDLKQIKGISSVTGADLVPGFNKYQGLLNSPADRIAETFGHEGAHGLFAIQNPAQAVGIQQMLNDRDAAMGNSKYPYPPEIVQKIEAADKALVPTERFAQQEEKIVNGELQADQKK